MDRSNDRRDAFAEELHLAELLCARLCHDLAGPIGAISNGAELLAEEAAESSASPEVLQLLADSAAAAAARMRFLRLALGGGQTVLSNDELRNIVQSLFDSGEAGLKLAWTETGRQPVPADLARMLLNLVLLARDSLPLGGLISVQALHELPPIRIVVSATGIGARPGSAAAAMNVASAVSLNARNAQGYLTARLAVRLSLTVAVDGAEDIVSFIAQPR